MFWGRPFSSAGSSGLPLSHGTLPTQPNPALSAAAKPGTPSLPQSDAQTLPKPGLKPLPKPGLKPLPKPGLKPLPKPGLKPLPVRRPAASNTVGPADTSLTVDTSSWYDSSVMAAGGQRRVYSQLSEAAQPPQKPDTPPAPQVATPRDTDTLKTLSEDTAVNVSTAMPVLAAPPTLGTQTVGLMDKPVGAARTTSQTHGGGSPLSHSQSIQGITKETNFSMVGYNHGAMAGNMPMTSMRNARFDDAPSFSPSTPKTRSSGTARMDKNIIPGQVAIALLQKAGLIRSPSLASQSGKGGPPRSSLNQGPSPRSKFASARSARSSLSQEPSTSSAVAQGSSSGGTPTQGPPPNSMLTQGTSPTSTPAQGLPQAEASLQETPPGGVFPQGPPPGGALPQGPPPGGALHQGPPPGGALPQGPPPRGTLTQGPPPRGALLQGMPPRGAFPQGMPPRGALPQGMPPRGALPQGMPPRWSLPQGMPPRGVLPQGMPPRGALPQGMTLGGAAPQRLTSGGVLPQGPPSGGVLPQGPPPGGVIHQIPPLGGALPQGPPPGGVLTQGLPLGGTLLQGLFPVVGITTGSPLGTVFTQVLPPRSTLTQGPPPIFTLTQGPPPSGTLIRGPPPSGPLIRGPPPRGSLMQGPPPGGVFPRGPPPRGVLPQGIAPVGTPSNDLTRPPPPIPPQKPELKETFDATTLTQGATDLEMAKPMPNRPEPSYYQVPQNVEPTAEKVEAAHVPLSQSESIPSEGVASLDAKLGVYKMASNATTGVSQPPPAANASTERTQAREENFTTPGEIPHPKTIFTEKNAEAKPQKKRPLLPTPPGLPLAPARRQPPPGAAWEGPQTMRAQKRPLLSTPPTVCPVEPSRKRALLETPITGPEPVQNLRMGNIPLSHSASPASADPAEDGVWTGRKQSVDGQYLEAGSPGSGEGQFGSGPAKEESLACGHDPAEFPWDRPPPKEESSWDTAIRVWYKATTKSTDNWYQAPDGNKTLPDCRPAGQGSTKGGNPVARKKGAMDDHYITRKMDTPPQSAPLGDRQKRPLKDTKCAKKVKMDNKYVARPTEPPSRSKPDKAKPGHHKPDGSKVGDSSAEDGEIESGERTPSPQLEPGERPPSPDDIVVVKEVPGSKDSRRVKPRPRANPPSGIGPDGDGHRMPKKTSRFEPDSEKYHSTEEQPDRVGPSGDGSSAPVKRQFPFVPLGRLPKKEDQRCSIGPGGDEYHKKENEPPRFAPKNDRHHSADDQSVRSNPKSGFQDEVGAKKPWINDELWKLIEERKAMHDAWRANPRDPTLRWAYVAKRNIVNAMLKKAKRDHYSPMMVNGSCMMNPNMEVIVIDEEPAEPSGPVEYPAPAQLNWESLNSAQPAAEESSSSEEEEESEASVRRLPFRAALFGVSMNILNSENSKPEEEEEEEVEEATVSGLPERSVFSGIPWDVIASVAGPGMPPRADSAQSANAASAKRAGPAAPGGRNKPEATGKPGGTTKGADKKAGHGKPSGAECVESGSGGNAWPGVAGYPGSGRPRQPWPGMPSYPGPGMPRHPGPGMLRHPGPGMPRHPGPGMPRHPGPGILRHPWPGMPRHPGPGLLRHPGPGLLRYPGHGMPRHSGPGMPGYAGPGMEGYAGQDMHGYAGEEMAGYGEQDDEMDEYASEDMATYAVSGSAEDPDAGSSGEAQSNRQSKITWHNRKGRGAQIWGEIAMQQWGRSGNSNQA